MARPPALELIGGFVRAFPGEAFCVKCLAVRLGLDVHSCRAVVTSLCSQPGYTVESRDCRTCGRRARTLSHDGVSRPPRCRLCGGEIGRDVDPVFLREGGVIHHACFVAASKQTAS